ncbi:MAG TPA: hypothetical protein VIH42_02080 [Thermoguttaceae bacterium]
MTLIIRKPPEGEFQLAPQGTHIARCYMVVDLGSQNTPFGAKHKIRVGWEFPNELMEDGRPFMIAKEYTASLHPDSNLAQDLVSWRGRAFTEEELGGFDIFKILGAPCMLTVIHTISKTGKQYANVKTVASLPKGTVKPEPVNDLISFSLDAPDEDQFSKLPEWLSKKINRSTNKQESSPDFPDFDDDIGF